jgi:hypothetical protein
LSARGGLPMDEPERLRGDFWGKGGLPMPTDQSHRRETVLREVLLRMQAEVRAREGALTKPEGEGGTETECAVCGHWPPDLRPAMRSAIEMIPLRATVCDDCLKVFWDTLPKGPRLER